MVETAALEGAADRAAAAELLLTWREDLALRSVAAFYEEDPEARERWGPRGRRYCLEDSLSHVEFLAAAVAFGAERTFRDYAAWGRDVLEARDIPARHLATHLRLLRRTLEEGAVPGLRLDLVLPVLKAGEEELRSATGP